MENCLNCNASSYKDIEEYKIDINNAIKEILNNNQRLSFALVVKKVKITPFVINKYPQLRTYVLERMKHYKEIRVIDGKIDRAVEKIIKSNENLTFMAIAKKCRFSLDTVYKNEYIKEKIINTIIENKKPIRL